MKKKILALILASTLAVSALASCNSQGSDDAKDTSNQETEESKDNAPCSHTGGKATCKDKAICSSCKEAYGELDATNHAGTSEWVKDDKSHSKKYTCCESILVEETAHLWNNGTCTECGHVCQHSTEDDICSFTPISTVDELKAISMNGKYYLTTDIDLGGAEWTMLGSDQESFEGIFDGNKHTLSNFKISDATDFAGFFCYNKGEIRNLGLKDFSIKMTSSKSDSFAGGLVAYNKGIIKNCYTTGNISSDSDESIVGGLIGTNTGNGTVTNCYATGDVSGEYVGGLIGYNIGNIQNCYATGNITSMNFEGIYAGGFIGYNHAEITNCYATGNVNALSTREICAGGFIGFSKVGKINNCYATGNITADVTAATMGSVVGAFIGQCGYDGDTEEALKITNSYRSADQVLTITGTAITNVEVPTKTIAELQSVSFQKATLGWSADTWTFTEGAYPTLKI